VGGLAVIPPLAKADHYGVHTIFILKCSTDTLYWYLCEPPLVPLEILTLCPCHVFITYQDKYRPSGKMLKQTANPIVPSITALSSNLTNPQRDWKYTHRF